MEYVFHAVRTSLLPIDFDRWAHQIWWGITLLANIPGLLITLQERKLAGARLQEIFSLLAVINLTVAIIVRNELILLALYVSFNHIRVGKFHSHRMLHSIGGLHVGAGVATFVWTVTYTLNLFTSATFTGTCQEWVLFSTALTLSLCLFMMISTAIRPIRERYHNLWEYTHRFVGWFSLFVLVLHVATKASIGPSPRLIFNTPLPYLITVCLVSVFYVWFTVRKVTVLAVAGKGVAILKFRGRPTLRDGTVARISTDFLQWHAFSVAMTDWERREFAVIVANTGDWTKSITDGVNNGTGPEQLWIRGVNPPGFMTMHRAFLL